MTHTFGASGRRRHDLQGDDPEASTAYVGAHTGCADVRQGGTNGYHRLDVKKALAILVVVIVVVTGVPLVMAGPMMCADCDAGAMAATCAFGILVAAGFALALLVSRLRRQRNAIEPRLFAFTLERPPRLA